MGQKALNLLFGCRHRSISRPFTGIAGRTGADRAYVVCLDCGQEFRYDTAEWRMGGPLPKATAPVGGFQTDWR
jgi:hypothetical protein